jgi:hypothetical protein
MTSARTPVYVDFRETGPVARITLNRPEKFNAINVEVGLQLYEAFARCESDSAIRAIVLAGAGRAFCAGDELGRERTPDEEVSFRRRGFIKHYVEGPGRWTRTLQRLSRLGRRSGWRVLASGLGAGPGPRPGGLRRGRASLQGEAAPEVHGPLGEAGGVHWPRGHMHTG